MVTLTAAPFIENLLKVYDVQKIERYVFLINRTKNNSIDFISLVNYVNLMTFDFYGKYRFVLIYLIIYRQKKLGPWDEKTGVFSPLFHQQYQTGPESLRNVVSKRKDSVRLI